MTAASDAPGWDAIDGALDRVYPGVQPQHLATILKWRLGGQQPLDGISIYPRGDHWHYVSYGMSELYEKESDDGEMSGWGFEFTFRPARVAGEEQAPVWAANLLQNLGRYVFTSGNSFGSGHFMTLNGPIDLSRPDTRIRHIGLAVDPELGTIDTPHGRLTFLLVVGLTDEEYEAAQAWSSESLFDVMRTRLPMLTTDTERGSLLDDPEIARTVAEGIARDGSSADSSYVTQLDWELGEHTNTLVLGALGAPRVATALRGRLPFGRPYAVISDDRELHVMPGDELAISEIEPSILHLTVPSEMVEPLVSTMGNRAGTLQAAPTLAVRIVPTEITNEADEVIDVIG